MILSHQFYCRSPLSKLESNRQISLSQPDLLTSALMEKSADKSDCDSLQQRLKENKARLDQAKQKSPFKLSLSRYDCWAVLEALGISF